MLKHRSSKTLTAPSGNQCGRPICLRWAALVFGAIATLLMVAACAPSGKKAAKGSATFVTTVPNEKAAIIYAAPMLECETAKGNCPEAVALLATRESVDPQNTEIRQCTSFLVSKDIMLTNSHCLPLDLRNANAKCSGRIQAVFGKTHSFPQQVYDCEKIIFASLISDDESLSAQSKAPDYAFIRLKKEVIRRKPLKLNRDGLPDRLDLKILAIDPSANETVGGTLRIRSCQTTQNTIKTPGYVHSFYPLAISGDCSTIKGNSGSPALDSNGQVRAIVFGGSLATEKIRTEGFEVPPRYNSTSELVNIGCIEAPLELRIMGPNPRCDAQSVSLNQIIDRLKEKTPSKAPALFEEWLKTAPPQFQFKLSSNTGDYEYPQVSCIADRALLSKDEVKRDFEVPVWGRRYAIAPDYRIQLISKELAKATLTVSIQVLGGAEENLVIQKREHLNSAALNIHPSSADGIPLCR